jgi:hypothetical protein
MGRPKERTSKYNILTTPLIKHMELSKIETDKDGFDLYLRVC